MKRLLLALVICLCMGCNAKVDIKQKQAGGVPVVVLETNQGIIKLRLMPQAAPIACDNFTGLIGKGYYNGIIFHRVIKDFMIQGGDPTGTGSGGESFWGMDFGDEVNPKVIFDKPGILAMANSGPKTNGSQFFITVKATPWLNGKHTIFGEVIAGYDVVKKIEGTATGPGDRPLKDQIIVRAYVENAADAAGPK